MLTSIIIATFNKLNYTKLCIESIRNYTPEGSYEIIVIDNNSSDGSKEWLASQRDIRTIFNPENLGFPKACNQGIGIAKGDNILLLNNDTVVTSNWLSNMIDCAYSSDDIGAVGTVTNNCSYGQAISIDYTTLDEMQEYALKHNVSDSSMWEERLKLVGYNMLIKRSVISQIGLLDEQFSPGNYEDDDYSYRIRKAGYKLILCNDTFIHHFGSTSFRENIQNYNELLKRNKEKFVEKWGFNPDTEFAINHEVINLISRPRNEAIRLLHMNCACGGTLLRVKYLFKNAELFGQETNPLVAESALGFSNVHIGFIEEAVEHYPDDFFDYLIVGEVAASFFQNPVLLKQIRSLLKEEGKILAISPNPQHYSVIRNVLRGGIDRTQLSNPNIGELENLFQSAGYHQLEISGLKSIMTQQDEQFCEELSKLVGADNAKAFEVQYFLVSASKIDELQVISKSLKRVLEQIDLTENLMRLRTYDAEQVIRIIENQYLNKIEIYNFLAINYLDLKQEEFVLPFLYQAFEIDEQHPTTLFNLGFAMYTLGQEELALDWFEMIPDKEDKLIEWISAIQTSLHEKEKENLKLSFLLRRIEYDIDMPDNLMEIIEEIKAANISLEVLLETINNEVYQKDQVANAIATVCYESGLYEFVMPLYEVSLSYNPQNDDTLYNLGMILYYEQDFANARLYLEQIQDKDQETLNLLASLIEGVLR